MKRYMAAVLVPCFLLQLLIGCYSYKDITFDELQAYSGSNVIRVTTSKEQLVINRQSSGESLMNWQIKDSSIFVQTTELVRDNSSSKAIENNYEIKFKDIQTLELSEYDGLKSGLLITGSIIVGIYIIAAIAFATSDWKINLGDHF